MKHQWSVEELVEQFTLLPDETALLVNKSGANCLGFALLLKFFQIEAKFPTSRKDLPQDFEAQRETYYKALKQPMEATAFTTQLHF